MKIKILVAEDEEVNFYYISEVLEGAGYQVFHAWDGSKAVELFKEEQPDLILMDIKMPVMDGYEALNQIKAIDKSVPIVALTAHALFGDKEKALNAGFDAYLSKPVMENTILEILNKFIHQ